MIKRIYHAIYYVHKFLNNYTQYLKQILSKTILIRIALKVSSFNILIINEV
jgi:hypothetical protein